MDITYEDMEHQNINKVNQTLGDLTRMTHPRKVNGVQLQFMIIQIETRDQFRINGLILVILIQTHKKDVIYGLATPV